MFFHDQVAQSLNALHGLMAPDTKTVAWQAADNVSVEVDFTAVESVGCAFRELRVIAGALEATSFATLQGWADELCRRVTYLLEQIGPLEADREAQTVLVRSSPPAKDAARTSFYEMLVHSPGVVSLRRYLCVAHDPARQAIDMQATHEVFLRLVRDLVEAVPHEQTLSPL
ncbi:MAG: hypothetical protein EXS05_02805 [Planctomycetaceae bacterium]|nr:hypothetical protein [Planctomycetaceae bacterium]